MFTVYEVYCLLHMNTYSTLSCRLILSRSTISSSISPILYWFWCSMNISHRVVILFLCSMNLHFVSILPPHLLTTSSSHHLTTLRSHLLITLQSHRLTFSPNNQFKLGFSGALDQIRKSLPSVCIACFQ